MQHMEVCNSYQCIFKDFFYCLYVIFLMIFLLLLVLIA